MRQTQLPSIDAMRIKSYSNPIPKLKQWSQDSDSIYITAPMARGKVFGRKAETKDDSLDHA